MIVISDTGPINYLLAIGHIDLLPRLFGRIVLPAAVVAELQSAEAPQINHIWTANLPAGFVVRSASRLDESIDLDAGEREAVCLAEELRAVAVLIDEKKGRQVARRRGLAVVGTLGVLERAAVLGWLDIETAMAKLRETNFFVSDDLLAAVVSRVKQGSNDG